MTSDTQHQAGGQHGRNRDNHPLSRIKPPSPEYVGPSPHVMHDSNGRPLDNKPIRRIVIHCTVTPSTAGTRYGVARGFRESERQASAHYVVDAGGAVQVVYDSLVAEHAPPNQGSIGIELCDAQAGPAKRWADADHQAIIRRAARLTARLCLAYGVPIRRLSVAQLLAGGHGICGHVDVSHAWHQTSHTDPGAAFPWTDFMERVHKHALYLQRKHRKAGGR